MPVHAIKLKGPWTVVWRPDGGAPLASAEPQTIHLPADCRPLFGNAAGVARFERRFNRPTNLGTIHRVLIRFRDVSGLLRAQVNDRECAIEAAPDGSQFIDVTDRLEPHNRLSVEVHSDPASRPELPTGLWQPVVLEIEEPENSQ